MPVETALNPDNTLEAGGRVPLLEDNAANIIVAETLLESLGCEIVIAGGGQEAIDRLLNERFDLAFMDVQMAGMDDYLTKPINISQFEALVRKYMGLRPKSRH